MIKKICSYILLFCLVFCCSLQVRALEDDTITIYLFHGDGCPHCAMASKFLTSIDDKYDNLDIIKYEVWYNRENSILMDSVRSNLDIRKNGVPLIIIGKSFILGYSDATGDKIERAIEYYRNNEYVDVVAQIRDGTFVKEKISDDLVKDEFSEQEKKTDESLTISVPFFKKVNLKNLSISTAAVLIGLVDGFNPCAMWVLLFLISVLIGMKDRRRMWILGLSFLITSALIYMLIMLSWLNIVVSISTSIWIRNIIAIVAILGAILNLRSYFKSQDSGCNVVDDKKRKKIFSKIKKFTHEKSLILALIGTICLAMSVNLVELACSAGLPIIFTQLLAINNVTGVSAFFYTLMYILFFLLDDLVVFFVAMFTMKVTGISTKYNKYSHLVGGVLMLIVGFLLIFKPEWLMFGGF